MSAIATESREFSVEVGSERGCGVLLVTDLTLMVRPAPTGQYHKNSPHDAARIAGIMDLGDYDDGYGMSWHIVTNLSASEAHALMHRAWHAYFDGYCMGKVWIDAEVRYIGAEGEVLHTRNYGFSEGHERGIVYVHTKALWESIHSSGDSAQADWTRFLRHNRLGDGPQQPVRLHELEGALRAGAFNQMNEGRLVIVQPSADETSGYTAKGFELPCD